MRHKYATPAIILHKVPVGEASAMYAMVTPELGYLWARAQSVRQSQSKLSHALQLLCESDLALVEGKQCWKIGGAVLGQNYARGLSLPAQKTLRNITHLFFSLVHEATPDPRFYYLIKSFLERLHTIGETDTEYLEYSVALALLSITGHADELPVPLSDVCSDAMLDHVRTHTNLTIEHINRGIHASTL